MEHYHELVSIAIKYYDFIMGKSKSSPREEMAMASQKVSAQGEVELFLSTFTLFGLAIYNPTSPL